MYLWDRIILRYFGGMAFKRKFTNKHETILWYVKPAYPITEPYFDVEPIREKARSYDTRNNFWGRNPGNVWEVDRVAAGSIEQTSHIAVYPESVTEKIIRACTKPGDLVLDPFSGSGTTPKVARTLGRRWVGIEISPAYAQESVRRVGFHQPSEMESLASGLIKHEILGGRRTSLSTPEVRKLLLNWMANTNLAELRECFQQQVEAALADESRSKPLKKDAWIKFDTLFETTGSNDPIVVADRVLLRDYKNRQTLNGAMRYRTALEQLEVLEAHLLDNSSQDLIERLAFQEPSTYALEDSILQVVANEKRFRMESSNLNTESVDSHDADEAFQARMPLF